MPLVENQPCIYRVPDRVEQGVEPVKLYTIGVRMCARLLTLVVAEPGID